MGLRKVAECPGATVDEEAFAGDFPGNAQRRVSAGLPMDIIIGEDAARAVPHT